MYVETDFLLALAKSDDWLREQAIAALEQYDDVNSPRGQAPGLPASTTRFALTASL